MMISKVRGPMAYYLESYIRFIHLHERKRTGDPVQESNQGQKQGRRRKPRFAPQSFVLLPPSLQKIKKKGVVTPNVATPTHQTRGIAANKNSVSLIFVVVVDLFILCCLFVLESLSLWFLV